jgi:2-iminobutanoate/2-iminopropanoate deaminase
MTNVPIQTDQAPEAIGPYSQAIKVGSTIFCSGQIPLKPNGELVQTSIEKQTRQVLQNLKAVITAAGCNMNHVVKTTIYLTSLADFAIVNGVYGEYFDEPFPARATVQVAKLPKDVNVEIDAICCI